MTKLMLDSGYFDDNSDAKHLNQEEVQKYIDEITEKLSSGSDDYYFITTGDTFIIGIRDVNCIDVFVTQNFLLGSLVKENDNNWYPVDYSLCKKDKDELIEEINKLRPQYNPNKEY